MKQPGKPARAAENAAAAQAATDVEDDADWPRDIPAAGGVITVYQPQPELLRGDNLSGRAALSFTKPGEKEPRFGVFWFQARLLTDKDERTAEIESVKVTKVRFREATAEEEKSLAAFIEQDAPKWDLGMSFDSLQASLRSAAMERQAAEDLKNDPPKIIFSEEPSLLVFIDGQPVVRAIENTKLERVVNTPYPLIFDPAAKAYYLTNGDLWYRAEAIMGPWRTIPQPPAEVARAIPKEAIEAGRKAAAEEGAAKKPERGPPRIVVATEPTEIIYTDGRPNYAAIEGTDLLYATNTESDLFMNAKDQEHYVLLSGRWYRSKSLEGPWTFVRADEMPEDFQQISPASPKGDTRAHIAGTEEAEDAVLDTQIPQTAAIKRSEAKLTATYDGEPRFERIPGTDIDYAVNTAQSVLRVNGRYYACDQGVWYVADSPAGPWAVSDSRPDGIDTIPPSSPVYHTKYVYVFDSTPDVVYVGYYPGYLGCYPYYGAVVWGTGWYYSPWIGPYFYPRHSTWGFHAHFDPWFGWSFGYGFSSAFCGVGTAWGWWGWPSHAHVYHHGGWFGPSGWRPSAHVHHQTNINVVSRINRFQNNLYVRPENRLRNAPRTALASSRVAARGRTRPAAAIRPNNVFADKDGTVFRRTPDSWEKRDSGRWAKSSIPAERPPAIEKPTVEKRTTGTPPAGKPQVEKPAAERPRVERPANRPQVEKPAPRREETPRAPGRRAETAPPQGGLEETQRPPVGREEAQRPPVGRDETQRSPFGRGQLQRPQGLERDFRARERGAVQSRSFQRAGGGGGSRGGGSGRR